MPASNSSSFTTASKANSSALRRTMSADMSSEMWRSYSGMKKTASMVQLYSLHEEDDNGGSATGSGVFDEFWSTIQREKRNNMEEPDLPRETGIWSSILSTQKANADDKASLPPPYIHPLVKRSASSLSEKSLEICTESLGSETGSDGFSSEPEDEQHQPAPPTQPEPQKQGKEEEEELRAPAARYSYSAAVKKEAKRCFPPPLPSLAHRGDGSNLHMRSRRQNGRLVLEAVSVPSQHCFRAQREGGRLLLTFSDNRRSSPPEEEEEEEEEEQVKDQESDWEDQEEDEGEGVKRENAGADEKHKFLCLTRGNTPPWPHRLNRAVAAPAEDDGCHSATAALTGGSLNQYVYCWRRSVLVEGKRAAQVEYLLPSLRGCNHHQQQPRRSLLWWEPRCIATT